MTTDQQPSEARFNPSSMYQFRNKTQCSLLKVRIIEGLGSRLLLIRYLIIYPMLIWKGKMKATSIKCRKVPHQKNKWINKTKFNHKQLPLRSTMLSKVITPMSLLIWKLLNIKLKNLRKILCARRGFIRQCLTRTLIRKAKSRACIGNLISLRSLPDQMLVG